MILTSTKELAPVLEGINQLLQKREHRARRERELATDVAQAS